MKKYSIRNIIIGIMTALIMALLVGPADTFAAAETLTATRAVSGFPVMGKGDAGMVKVAYGTYDVAANVEDGDIFQMCRLPAGATVVGGYFKGDDLDTNATETLDLDVGWAANGNTGTYDTADPDGLANLGVLTGDAFVTGNVANVVSYNYPLNGLMNTGVMIKFTAETIIQIEANAACATFAAGTISLFVYYTMD